VLYSDTLYTLLFTLAVILTIRMLAEPDLKIALLCGLVTGIATLVHIRALYLPVLLALLFIGVMLKKGVSTKRSLVYGGAYLLLFFLTLLPWRLRNQAEFGVANLSSVAGFNTLHYSAALAESAETGEDRQSIIARYERELRAEHSQPLNQAEYGRLAFRAGLEKILERPLNFMWVQITGMAKVLVPGRHTINTLITGQMKDEIEFVPWFVRGYIIFEAIYLALIYLLGLATILRERRSSLWVWLLVLILVYLIVVAGAAGMPRFRVAMMPLLCVLAAMSLEWGLANWGRPGFLTQFLGLYPDSIGEGG
jgi:hypothetical protein